MPLLKLLIELESPLAISQSRLSNTIPTLDYVPSHALRGAVATHLAHSIDPSDEMFALSIVKGEARFSSAWAVPNGVTYDAFPTPLSLLTCKRFSGFLENGFHGIEDSLIRDTWFACTGVSDYVRPLRHCTNGCEESVLNGFRKRLIENTRENYSAAPPVGKRMQTHVGLDRRRHGSAAGILYSREVVNESNDSSHDNKTRFQASISVSPRAGQWLLERLKVGSLLTIGNAVSRGLGRCRVSQLVEIDTQDDLEQRVSMFNECVEQHGSLAGKFWISITLRTPAFFVDPFLAPNLAPSGIDLLQAAERDEIEWATILSPLKKIYQNARAYRLTSWNQLAGFPRTTEIGLAAGSVMVFQSDQLSADLLAALRHLESAGIGLRREAGFGMVRVCDPIHVKLHQITQKIRPMA